MLLKPPRCRPFPVLALKGADSPRGLHRGHSPGHMSPQVLEAQGAVGCSRQVGPIRKAYDRSIRITMRGTGGDTRRAATSAALLNTIGVMAPHPKLIVGRQAGSYCCRAASTPAMFATAAGAKAGGIGLVGPRALAAYLPCHPEHLLRNIMAKLKLEAMGRHSDPLTHGPLDVLL